MLYRLSYPLARSGNRTRDNRVVLPAFAVMLIWVVATRNGETRSLSYVPAAGLEPASPIRPCGFPGALLVGPLLRM